MRATRISRFELLVVTVFLAELIPASSGFAYQGARASAANIGESSAPLRPAPAGLTGDGVIAKMLARNKAQSRRLERYSEIRTYEVRNVKGKLAARTTVRVEYRAPGEKSFRKTSEQGSWIVRHLVFDRLISAERETASGREHHDSAITPRNYRFTLLGEQDLGQYHCFVVEATPKRNEKYLFDGKIWIDSHEFAVVRIAGHPAKKLSFWIHRVEFVRQYQQIEGFWLPHEDTTFVDVRFYGKKTFAIEHSHYSINEASPSDRGAQDLSGEK